MKKKKIMKYKENKIIKMKKKIMEIHNKNKIMKNNRR